MDDALSQVERQLLVAIRAHLAGRRSRRRRRTIALAVAAALLAAGSAASALSGDGPLADVLGVNENDPTLQSVREVPDAPRAVVKVRGGDGHLYTFAGFHARRRIAGPSGRSVCSTQTRDDATRIPSLGCIRPDLLAQGLRRDGIMGGPYWGSSQAGGLRLTGTASGFVPADARRVIMRHGSAASVDARLSEPFPVNLRAPSTPARARAFLAVASFDYDGAEWLGPPVERSLTVVRADGATQRQTMLEPQFFPMVERSGPEGPLIRMGHPGRPSAWRSVGFRGAGGTLCTAAAPVGERLIRPGMLQCSSPLAVVNALSRYGAALYLSNFNPRRERGRRTVAAFGFTRADATHLSLVDGRGRRYGAKLSRPWGTATRQPRDLAHAESDLRRRLARLPRRMTVRSWIASLDVPPEPGERGLRLRVELNGGRVLRAGPNP